MISEEILNVGFNAAEAWTTKSFKLICIGWSLKSLFVLRYTDSHWFAKIVP